LFGIFLLPLVLQKQTYVGSAFVQKVPEGDMMSNLVDVGAKVSNV